MTRHESLPWTTQVIRMGGAAPTFTTSPTAGVPWGHQLKMRRPQLAIRPNILIAMGTNFDRRTALIVVDVQNDFADPKGALFVKGGELVATRAGQLMQEARRQGALVVCSQDWHPLQTPHFADQGGIWPRHCVQDTWGAELHPCLPEPEQVIRKGLGDQDGYSAFGTLSLATGEVVPTPLAELLSRRGIEAVVVAGLALDVCVKATALDAATSGFSTHVIANATAAVNLQRGDGDRALAEMSERGIAVV